MNKIGKALTALSASAGLLLGPATAAQAAPHPADSSDQIIAVDVGCGPTGVREFDGTSYTLSRPQGLKVAKHGSGNAVKSVRLATNAWGVTEKVYDGNGRLLFSKRHSSDSIYDHVYYQLEGGKYRGPEDRWISLCPFAV